ncbi:MAG: bifunctional serine/threonine-protein kinase/formylglycine-generating enzyme family protein, partial [Tepidisphaeraceae bacterium]
HRFEREAAILAGLDHPGVVGIIDRGRTADGSFFIVMDHIDGENLDVFLSRHRQPPGQRAVLRLFAKIAHAVHEAHSHGVVHRDLKPSNIMVDRRWDPHVLDFGLAHLTCCQTEHYDCRLTVTGNVVGSLPWASPEQAVGNVRELAPSSDVYSLGLLLYQTLTGHSPYPLTGTLHEITQNICKTTPPAPETALQPPFGRIDRKLADVIRKSIEKSPSRRYPTAGGLAADLENYLYGRPTSVAPGIRWQRYIRATILPLALVLATGIWTVLSYPSQPLITPIELPRTTNSIGMEFIRVPSGGFRMGSDTSESGLRNNESLHTVIISKPFWIGRTEVTRGQYRRVMGSVPVALAAEDLRLPVDRVSWNDAVEFCQRLGAVDGRTYRLPTEAEWEYACRGGTGLPFSGTGRLDDMGWYAENSGRRLHPVGWKQPNHWGLHDMLGNVSEWCADEYQGYLGTETVTDPFVPPAGFSRVIRGGDALAEVPACRAASRDNTFPDRARPALGFRVVMEFRPPASPTTSKSGSL